MTDLKTTIAGIVIGIATIVKAFGGPEFNQGILDAIIAMGTMLAFYFAKDKGKEKI